VKSLTLLAPTSEEGIPEEEVAEGVIRAERLSIADDKICNVPKI
jgi:hypothetical protein